MEDIEVKTEKKGIINKINVWHVTTAVFGILLITSLLTGGFGIKNITGQTTNKIENALSVVILSDERCSDCQLYVLSLKPQLMSLFPNLNIKEVDYDSKEGKEIYTDSGVQYLPAVLFDEKVKDSNGYTNIANYLVQEGNYLSLRIGAEFDPEAEICDNKIDDDDDKVIDCQDTDCKGEWTCMEKKDVPEVELFVMSHCPFGTQVEKGILPVAELLGSKINFKVKFVDYAMHGEKEVYEELNQYCIQKEQSDKFLTYLKCFLEEGDGSSCIKETNIDEAKLKTCAANTDNTFKITANLNNKATWKGSYPSFDVDKTDVVKYEVQGSPTLVINGVVAETGRDPNSLLDAVCLGFKNTASECTRNLSSETPGSGFGFGTTSTTGSNAGCGV